MRKLPGNNRLKEDRIFLDEYVKDMSDAAAILAYAYGDTIILLKSQRSPTHVINVSGNEDVRGRFGGRRFDIPTGLQPAIQPNKSEFGRPEENDVQQIKIPAIVDFMSGTGVTQGPGRNISEKPTVFISTKIMLDMGIEIIPEEDMLQYKGKKYKIINSYSRMNFLDSEAEKAYEIEETK